MGFAREPDFVFRHGPLELTFDPANGHLLKLAYRGEAIAAPPESAPPITFGVGPAGKVLWFEQMKLPRRVVKQVRPSEDSFQLTIEAGPYQFVEAYRIHAVTARLDRSVLLVNRGPETVILRGLAYRTAGVKVGNDGFYRMPTAWPPASHAFSEMTPGKKRQSRGSIGAALAQLSPHRTLIWSAFTHESPHVEITEGKGELDVRQVVQAAGYLRPGTVHDLGFVSMQVADADYWAALPKLWDWMDSVGLRVPADRPDWLHGAVLYSFHPGGTIGSNFKDLGGFEAATKRLLPTLPRLGVDSIWIMPIEYKSPYWPLDYYRFMDGIGNAEQYKRLVARAHELKLKVLQDLVPHGGAPQAVHNQAHPDFMLRREDGSHLDYWLNDFAWPAWQDFIAGVARHYVQTFGIDGYRVDACFGSKEMNWNPAIPYARASLSMLEGGLGMLSRIRAEVRREQPKTGAVLAEVESSRHLAVSDFVYDFGFCYNLCRQWLRMEPASFVQSLQEYLEEQKYVEPRGAIRLRHVESHDSLRAQGWYGVEGMRAMYALSAWIDGVPLIYHGMEDGHGFELARINRIRHERPELARGECDFRAVQCDAPGVFTCLRRLGDRSNVVAINFGRDPVRANLKWPGGAATVELGPLGYTVLPKPADEPAAAQKPTSKPAAARVVRLDDTIRFANAKEWFVDTIEGRLHDAVTGSRTAGPGFQSSIYWRPQGTGQFWSAEKLPLNPACPRLGVKGSNGRWSVYNIKNIGESRLRLMPGTADEPGVQLVGGDGLEAALEESDSLPPSPDVTKPISLGGVSLRCVGSTLIVSNRHFTLELGRGGVIRRWTVGGQVLAEQQDFYGDQEYFASKNGSRVNAASDVECGYRVWTEPDGLHLRFEGQLRGDYRFALKRPALMHRVEYVVSDSPRFTQRWAFRTERDIDNKKAFLANFVGRIDAERFRFERTGKMVAEGELGEDSGRRGETRGKPTPDALRFALAGKPDWSITGIHLPEGRTSQIFLQAHKLFITALDGGVATMKAGQWREFEMTWGAGK